MRSNVFHEFMGILRNGPLTDLDMNLILGIPFDKGFPRHSRSEGNDSCAAPFLVVNAQNSGPTALTEPAIQGGFLGRQQQFGAIPFLRLTAHD